MKKRLTAIILSVCLALSLTISASASSIGSPSMGGGSTLAMTDEIYTEYYLILQYLNGLNQLERMESYIMRLYDDYGLSVSVISEAFPLQYSFVEEVVMKYTEGRDPYKTDQVYEDWKNADGNESPVEENPEEGNTEGNNPGTGSGNGSGSGSQNPTEPTTPPTTESPDESDPKKNPNMGPGRQPNLIIPEGYDPNTNQQVPPMPDILTQTPETTAKAEAPNEAQLADELVRNIVYAKISGNEAEIQTYLDQLAEDEITFEQLIILSESGVEGLETLLRSYGKNLSFLGDLISSDFSTIHASAPKKTEPVATGATAVPTPSKVLINDVPVAFESYNINGNNFFKLRDLAFALTDSEKQFEVTWDANASVIALLSGLPYTVAGGEMAAKGTEAKNALPTKARVFIDGEEISFTAYNIDGNNYFKLRDIGEFFDFGIGWDADTSTITVDTSSPYVQ